MLEVKLPELSDLADADFRTAAPAALAAALRASRRDTLATLARFEAHLPGLQVPQQGTLNPPQWELGHIQWFQQYWLARQPQAMRQQGWLADPHAERCPTIFPDNDALFDSSRVAHASRWNLPLPALPTLRQASEAGLATTLHLLEQADHSDPGLYFYRLVLAHEDMHHEAALYMAQALGLPLDDARWQAKPLLQPRQSLRLLAGTFEQGWQGPGFAFDNEWGAHRCALPASQIDSRVLSWAEFLPFVEAEGYADPGWWSDAGRAWLAAGAAPSSHSSHSPRYLRRQDPDARQAPQGSPPGAWQQHIGGRWQALDLRLPACHLSAFEAEAWCAWAGRRLPTESEWERAAVQGDADFHWGQVWEWTASPFEPYPGFVAHPYRDYSAPWFGSRRVLRGASFGTQPRLHHRRYRNYFTPDRNDIFAGFRSCAL